MSYGFKVWIWFRNDTVEIFRNAAVIYAHRDDMVFSTLSEEVGNCLTCLTWTWMRACLLQRRKCDGRILCCT